MSITELKKIFGQNNIQFQMIANKLANEIMQCAIEFYNTHREEESEFDPGEDALRITKYANSIGATGQVKNRIIENTQPIQEWVESKGEREKQKVIEIDLKFITTKLENFQNLYENIDNARGLVSSCKPKLLNVKNELGYNNELYLHLSSAVANNALGMVINVVNKEQDALQYDRTKIISLPTILSNAVSVINLIGSLDMVSEIQTRYNTNKTAISSINNQVSAISRQVRNTAQNHNSNSDSGGCYIATMVYKDYNHPQVLVLRQFRDKKLAKTFIGRGFINFYYATSPKLVSLLKNNKTINQLIKSILEKIILKFDII